MCLTARLWKLEYTGCECLGLPVQVKNEQIELLGSHQTEKNFLGKTHGKKVSVHYFFIPTWILPLEISIAMYYFIQGCLVIG